MSKFSVKKPFTVFVAVIAILVLGVVAYFRMTPDLLPNMDFPYVMIMTTYPGASPEKVEAEVTNPWNNPCPPWSTSRKSPPPPVRISAW